MPGPTSRRRFLATLLAAGPAGHFLRAGGTAAAAVELVAPREGEVRRDFSFLHFSDTHIDARAAGAEYDPGGRSVRTLAWLGQRSVARVIQPPYGTETAPPVFAIHTGDVFEYSLVDHTWEDFSTAASEIKCPVCLVPGNHDNTWGEINHHLRQLYGNDSYSFDFGGCHFVCLNSAGLLDPLPCLDRRTIDWLQADLSTVLPARPILLALHHPLSGDAGYASEYDKLRLWNVLHGRNVALILDGHWHSVHCQRWQGIDRVNGGATFGRHTGCNLITIANGVIRVTFMYRDETAQRPQFVPLLEKPLERADEIMFVSLNVDTQVPHGGMARCSLTTSSGSHVATAWIDEDVTASRPLAQAADAMVARLPTTGCDAGWHYVTVEVARTEGEPLRFAERFQVLPPRDAAYIVHETHLGAGLKSCPHISGETVIAADTAGTITAFTGQLERIWTYATDSQIVHSLAVSGDRLLAGDVDGNLHCLRLFDGSRLWRASLPHPLYAPVAAAGGQLIYVCDGWGWLHAVRLDEGRRLWSHRLARHGFEAQPVLRGQLLLAGAWDGFLYGFDLENRKLAWKTRGPTGHTTSPSRYYAAADVPPLVFEDALFLCDRGWQLGQYSLDGEFRGLLAERISAIGSSPDGRHFYSRSLDDRLQKWTAAGESVWHVETPLGRAPVPPVELADRVAVVSDRGQLAVFRAADGAPVLRYRVSPGLYCLSGIGTDGNRRLATGDMDGQLTCLTTV